MNLYTNLTFKFKRGVA